MNIFAMKAIPSSKIVPMKIRLLPDTMETESEAWAIGTNESAKRISVLVSGKGDGNEWDSKRLIHLIMRLASMKLPFTVFEDTEIDQMEVGVIGAGKITERIHIPILLEYPKTIVKYVADIDIDRANKLAKICGCDAIEVEEEIEKLPECDIVLLAMPVGVRKPYIELFSRRETPIFVENPFAKNIEDHQEFVGLNNKMVCNYMRTWFSSTKQMREIVRSELFGPLKNVRIQEGLVNSLGMGKKHYRNDIRLAGGGVLMESGCHTISQIVDILEGYDITVKKSDIMWKDELDVAVEVVMVASKDSDVKIEYRASRVESFEAEAEFEFQNVKIRFDHTGSNERLRVYVKGMEGPLIIESEGYATSFGEGVFLKWAEFIQQICSEGEMNTDQMTGMKVTEIITGIYKKTKGGIKI